LSTYSNLLFNHPEASFTKKCALVEKDGDAFRPWIASPVIRGWAPQPSHIHLPSWLLNEMIINPSRNKCPLFCHFFATFFQKFLKESNKILFK
jgi:hypothetical protein